MGYTTDFSGQFDLDKPLTAEHSAYLLALNRTRRMKRKPEVVETFPDPIRIAAGLPIGVDGEFYVGSTADFGQEKDASIVDYNYPPATQPGLWCNWVPGVGGAVIEWDGGEKFYSYVEWLEYIIEKLLQPWGYVLNGSVEWNGEDRDDIGVIVVKDNHITTKRGKVVYE